MGFKALFNLGSTLVAASFVLGCGPDFDPPSELRSLRVLAVEKDVPYAQPGQTVNLQVLWRDAAPSAPRPVQIAWSQACIDPPGDLYYSCFADAANFTGLATLDRETTSVTLPEDIISRRMPSAENNATYGVAYVFFALCAGELTLLSNGDSSAFPIGCKDAAGNLLGPDDFVAGYTAIYSFANFSNNNPVISGFTFNGYAFPPATNGDGGGAGAGGEAGAASGDEPALPDANGFCVGAACRPLAGESAPVDFVCSDPEQAARCVPTCKDDGDSACPAYRLKPLIDKADPRNADIDDVSAAQLGRRVGEQMWIDYYTEAGGFKSPVRLLNDATAGWNDDYGTDFYAPKAAGPFRVWAVAHDNRGGVAWAGVTLKAE